MKASQLLKECRWRERREREREESSDTDTNIFIQLSRTNLCDKHVIGWILHDLACDATFNLSHA